MPEPEANPSTGEQKPADGRVKKVGKRLLIGAGVVGTGALAFLGVTNHNSGQEIKTNQPTPVVSEAPSTVTTESLPAPAETTVTVTPPAETATSTDSVIEQGDQSADPTTPRDTSGEPHLVTNNGSGVEEVPTASSTDSTSVIEPGDPTADPNTPRDPSGEPHLVTNGDGSGVYTPPNS